MKKSIKNRKTNLKKYASGGLAYKTPEEVIMEQEILSAKAEEKANKNGWVQGLNIFGNMAMEVGGSMMQQGMSKGEGKSKSGFNWGKLVNTGVNLVGKSAQTQYSAYGGIIENVDVEAEGQEVVETPEGNVGEFEGPSHENGGVPTQLPEGSAIYSKRIKKDGKTMAERKKKRESLLSKIDKKLNGEKRLDKAEANSLGRRKAGILAEDFKDLQIQQIVEGVNKKNTEIENFEEETGGIENAVKQTMAYGTNYLRKKKTSLITDDPQFENGYFPLEGEDTDGGEEDILGDVLEGDEDNFNTRRGQKISEQNYAINDPNADEINDKFFENRPQKNESMLSEEDFSLDSPTVDDSNSPLENIYKPENTSPSFMDKLKGFGSKVADGYENSDLSKMSIGDVIGLVSTYKGARAGLNNTLENRAGDTPNVNYFKDYGKEALKTVQASKGSAKQVLDETKKDINRSRRSLIGRNRLTARSVNTMRALDIAAEAQSNIANGDAMAAYANTMQGILQNQAQTQLNIDSVRMQGETNRDLADRQDRDNFYTQKGKDLASMYEGYQRIGKHLNDIKEREQLRKLLNQDGTLVKYDKNGNIVSVSKADKKDKEDKKNKESKKDTKD